MYEPEESVKRSSSASLSWNGEFYFSYGAGDARTWDDAQKYGFVSAGGGFWYNKTMRNLKPGDRIWVLIPHEGYVGVGIVTEEVKTANESRFIINDQERNFFDLDLKGTYNKNASQDEEEHLVKVKWEKCVPQNEAVSEYGFFGNQNIVCRPKDEKWNFTIKRLKDLWGILD